MTAGVLLWVMLCGALAWFARWRVPGPLWHGGLLVTTLPLQLLAVSSLRRAPEVVATAAAGQRVALRQALAAEALFHEVFGLLLGLTVIGVAGAAMAAAQLFSGGPQRRWTWSQGGMGALVMTVGTALVLVFGLWGGAGGSALLLATWLFTGALLFGAGCIRVEDDHRGRQHSGRVMLAFTLVVGTVIASLAGVHLAQGTNLAALAVAGPVEAAILELEGWQALDTARKAGLVSVMMAVVAAGASTGGSLPQASDPRGTLSALVMALGFGVFLAVEGAVFVSLSGLMEVGR